MSLDFSFQSCNLSALVQEGVKVLPCIVFITRQALRPNKPEPSKRGWFWALSQHIWRNWIENTNTIIRIYVRNILWTRKRSQSWMVLPCFAMFWPSCFCMQKPSFAVIFLSPFFPRSFSNAWLYKTPTQNPATKREHPNKKKKKIWISPNTYNYQEYHMILEVLQ